MAKSSDRENPVMIENVDVWMNGRTENQYAYIAPACLNRSGKNKWPFCYLVNPFISGIPIRDIGKQCRSRSDAVVPGV